MSTVICAIKSQFIYPVLEDAGVLPGAQVGRLVQPSWKKEVFGLQPCPLGHLKSGRPFKIGQWLPAVAWQVSEVVWQYAPLLVDWLVMVEAAIHS